MASSMRQDAILGIAFGALFGALFILVCIISAVKAVKDRKRIKAKIAEKYRLRLHIASDYDVTTECVANTMPVEVGTTNDVTGRGVENVRTLISVSAMNQSSHVVDNNDEGKTTDPVSVEMNCIVERDCACADNDVSDYRRRPASQTDRYASNLPTISIHSGGDQNFTYRNKAWETPRRGSNPRNAAIESSRDAIEVVNAGSHDRDNGARKDTTFFGSRSGRLSDMNFGMYRFIGDHNNGYRNAAYE